MRRVAGFGVAVAAVLAIVTGAAHPQDRTAEQAGDAGWQKATPTVVLADAGWQKATPTAARTDAGWQKATPTAARTDAGWQ
ncbi:hypothetical protein GCM10010503_33150 [Streptomyces lucensis JCM 4490]|uniref:Secreted protein n=1 Tax=Streptomyces lucensis JCM 4490 TaxID=1306176 RepID=A0A918J971_9ACTN|nr:hypothetical protein [Streptomyces lucensis]GGW53310.1 hypothetical protein GCM10010503_33150 [Streptomyces lucensis JCM 4490]